MEITVSTTNAISARINEVHIYSLMTVATGLPNRNEKPRFPVNVPPSQRK
jgi:hypothetical protein